MSISKEATTNLTRRSVPRAVAAAAGLEVDGPIGGADIDQVVERIYATPPAVIERVRKAMQ